MAETIGPNVSGNQRRNAGIVGLLFASTAGAIPAFYTESGELIPRVASAAYQISQIYRGGLIPIIAGLLLNAYGIHRASVYIGLLIMVYAALAILATLRTPDTTKTRLEAMASQT